MKKHLQKIQEVAEKISATRWMAAITDINEIDKANNLMKACKQADDELQVLTEDFLKAFPHIRENDLKEFIREIQAEEMMIVDAAQKIERFQKKKEKAFKSFLQKRDILMNEDDV